MDELETKQAATEGLLMELLALMPPAVISRLVEIVGRWPDPDQRAFALQQLDDALRRYDELIVGQVLPGEDP